MDERIEELNNQEKKSTIDLIFDEIDVDNSGELTSEEFSNWWLKNGGDEKRLETVQQAFQIIAKRDGNPTCSPKEFREVPALPPRFERLPGASTSCKPCSC